MKKFIAPLFLIFLFSCDDGSFDVPALDFTAENIQFCDTFVFYKIKDNESLIINLNTSNTAQEFLLTERDDTNNTFTLSQNGSNTINYRTFNETLTSNYFCQLIPPVSPTVNKEWLGSAELVLTNTITNDDNDGVEELDLTLNTDGDATPNYLDNDDDGDGVLTINELDSDGNLIDTDSDGIYDYLDTDDDNDSVLTINEGLTDSNNDALSIPDYLDATTSLTLTTPRDLITDSYISSYSITFTLSNLVLTDSNSDSITYTTYNYGVLTGNYTITD